MPPDASGGIFINIFIGLKRRYSDVCCTPSSLFFAPVLQALFPFDLCLFLDWQMQPPL